MSLNALDLFKSFLTDSWLFSKPEKVRAVCHFEIHKYLGTWYEVARMDSIKEKNLKNTFATYSLNEDGNVQIINKSFDDNKKKWKKNIGIARFIDSENEARLKVSFSRLFWRPYTVIEIDAEYRYALVVGRNFNDLWILSREKTIPKGIKQYYLIKAKSLGYNTENLVWPNQEVIQ